MVVLNDLIQRDQFNREVLLASIRKSVFWGSNVIVNDSELTKLMQANVGSVFEFDYFLDLADDVPNISDDSNTLAVPNGIGTDTSRAIGNYRNQSWAAKNITANLSSTGDPLTAIAGRVGAYWARIMDFTSISIIKGILADNIVSNASDMINNQSGVPIDINIILDGVQTMGDAQDGLGIMIAHSAIVTSLKKQGVLDRIYDENGNFLFEALSGRRIVMNDSVPTGIDIPGGAAGDYLSYIVSSGLIGYGQGAPKRASEVAYDALTGNGAGAETLVTRQNFCLAPYGFSFLSTTVASTSPTNVEFEDAGNWERDVDRKRVGLAAIISTI